MITYEPHSSAVLTLHWAQCPSFRRAGVFAFLGSMLALGLGVIKQEVDEEWSVYLEEVLTVPSSVFSAVSGITGFLVVFRVGHSYNRFWDGSLHLYKLKEAWFTFFKETISFTRLPTADTEKIKTFWARLAHLVSLCNVMCMGKLEGSEKPVAHWFDVIGVEGLDAESLEALSNSSFQVELVHQWIYNLVVEAVHNGVLAVPPPILGACFASLNAPLHHYYSSRRLTMVPFPYPFAASAEVMMIFQTVFTAMAMFAWCEPGTAAVFTFAFTFTLWCIHLVAADLENPFGTDVNDLPMEQLHVELTGLMQQAVSAVGQSMPVVKDVDQVQLKAQHSFNSVRKSSKNNVVQ